MVRNQVIQQQSLHQCNFQILYFDLEQCFDETHYWKEKNFLAFFLKGAKCYWDRKKIKNKDIEWLKVMKNIYLNVKQISYVDTKRDFLRQRTLLHTRLSRTGHINTLHRLNEIASIDVNITTGQ